jgi:hypothetical protein
MKIFGITVILLLTFNNQIAAQEIIMARLTVDAGNSKRQDTPVGASLEGIDYKTGEETLRLYELTENGRKEVACQIESSYCPRIWWILDGETPAKKIRKFILVKDSFIETKNNITTTLTYNYLLIKRNGFNVLQYNTTEKYPSDNADPVYKRSGFIHPLWSPSGNVLSRINPPDHLHHMGIWNPWTKTIFEGHNTDFWNLYEGQGTVRFAGFNSIIHGSVYGGFRARQEHIDFQAKGSDKVAMNEVWDVRIWNIASPDSADFYLIDFTTILNCATDSPILLEAYRYGGGIGFRASEEWTNENSWILTSEGKDRSNADGTRARWCNVWGRFIKHGISGILFMSHPSNREFPEPMRVWPIDANEGRGDLFFEFCPVRDKNWELKPGNDYVLKYRLLVYDGQIKSAKAESLWNDFANPPLVTIEK